MRREGRLIAFLVGFLSQGRADTAYVHFLAVAPDERGTGLGRQLHERFADTAQLDGRTVVEAITSAGNAPSQHFHRRLGFTVGEPIADYDGAGASRVVFWRAL